MAERTIKTKLLVRTDTTANWESENPILQANEFGFDSTVQAFKKGDGTTTWKNLEYVTDTRLANKTEIANANERVYLVIGNTTGTAGTWTGTNERITSYFDGLLINYKIGVAGGSSTTTLNINGLGAKTIYLRGTTKLTTHYEVGTMVLLSYNSSKGAFYSADYDANSYAYARQYKVSTNAEYPMLFSYVTTIPSSYDTNYTGKNGGITVNPSTGTITATTFKGNATSSTKATQDGNGNVISETYATKEELENAILNGGGSEEQWIQKTGDTVLTEPEYIYIASPLTAFIYHTIAEGRAIAEGMSIKVYRDPTSPTYTFAIFNGSDFEFEAECEATKYNNVYRVSSMGGWALMPITMTPNDDVYFINEPIEDYYTKEEIDEKLTIIDEKFTNLDITDISDLPNELETIGNQLYNKVDKVSGKGLSTNDYTTTEKNKLAGISAGAEVNVQSDWNATSGDAFIKNKPKIPTKVTDLSDASNYAKLEEQNDFMGDNYFNGDSYFYGDNTFDSNNTFGGSNVFSGVNTFQNVLKDKNGSNGTNGQVLTSTGSGVEWRTPSSSGGSSSGGASYPIIDLGGNSIYESPIVGIITLENINKIIQAGGFISEIDSEDGWKKPFIISYISDTEISLEMRIDYLEDSYSEFFSCWIDRENLEYNVTFETTPIIKQNNFDNIAFKDMDNTFIGDNWFEGEVSFNNLIYVNSIGDANGYLGQNGQVLTMNSNGKVVWRTPSSSGGSGGGSTPRTIINASRNPTAYSVAFFEDENEGGYNLDITLNLPNAYFKLDLEQIRQFEDIELDRVRRLNISSNYNDVKVFVYTSNAHNVRSDYPYFTFNCSNGFLFVENGSMNAGDIYIDGASNYGDESSYVSLYCDDNIFKYTFYAYYDEIGNCHISYSLSGYEV